MKFKKILPALIGVAGVYFIWKYFKSKKEDKSAKSAGSIADKSQPLDVAPPAPKPSVKLAEPSAKAQTYIVKTSSGTLNLRQLPNTTSKIIGKYNSGDEVKAQPSAAVSGWSEILDTKGSFPVVIGYVSSKYLVKK